MTTPRYCKEWRVDTERNGLRRVPVGPAHARVRMWIDRGFSHTQIAAAASCARSEIDDIARQAHPTINRSIERKVLAAILTDAHIPAGFQIDATGTRRRIQALFANGHDFTSLTEDLDLVVSAVTRIANGHYAHVRKATFDRVADAYERLKSTPGASKRAVTLAARRGWQGPDAWDDNIDDPSAKPYAELHLSRAEEAEERCKEVLLLADAGVLKPEIAERVGLSLCRVDDLLREHRPVLVRQIKALADAERGNQQRRKAA